METNLDDSKSAAPLIFPWFSKTGNPAPVNKCTNRPLQKCDTLRHLSQHVNALLERKSSQRIFTQQSSLWKDKNYISLTFLYSKILQKQTLVSYNKIRGCEQHTKAKMFDKFWLTDVANGVFTNYSLGLKLLICGRRIV